jgi:hypothetical protein
MVLVHASHHPKTVLAVKTGKPVDSIPGLKGTGAAEEDGNPNKGMFVFEDGFNAWYFDDADRHRFDGPCKKEGTEYVCRRTIEKLWYDGKKFVPVAGMDAKAIYLVAMRSKWKPDYSGKHVLQITCLSLVFTKGK